MIATLFLAASILAVAFNVVVLRGKLSPTLLFCAGIAAQIFSGSSGRLGLPIGLDRVFFAAAFIWLFSSSPSPLRIFGSRRVHYLLGVVVVVTVISAAFAGTLFRSDGFYGVLDTIGVVPFLAFIFAPQLFQTLAQRLMLLYTLSGVGLYLGVTAILESTHKWSWIIPSYIADPSQGSHFGRARGPFLEATAMGLALIMCGAAAAVASTLDEEKWRQIALRSIAALCFFGTLLTLTRSVWIAAVLSAVIALAVYPSTRRLLIPLGGAAVVAIVMALTFIPNLGSSAQERKGDESSIWIRNNTNNAAIRAIEDRPLFGVGFNNFIHVSDRYLRQGDNIPLTGFKTGVHNVVLSRLAELGIIGGGLWLAAFYICIVLPAFRRAPPGMQTWRQGFIACAVAWVTVAMFAPTTPAFPIMVLWTMAGILNAERDKQQRAREMQREVVYA